MSDLVERVATEIIYPQTKQQPTGCPCPIRPLTKESHDDRQPTRTPGMAGEKAEGERVMWEGSAIYAVGDIVSMGKVVKTRRLRGGRRKLWLSTGATIMLYGDAADVPAKSISGREYRLTVTSAKPSRSPL